MKAEIAFYKHNWWMYLIGGIATLLFGFVAVVNPALTTVSLAFFFGLWLVIMGVLSIIASLSSGRAKSLWILNLIIGALITGIGIYILQRPSLAIATFVVYIAIALLLHGVGHFVEVFDSQYSGMYRTWQAIAGVVAVLASVFIWRYPAKGTLAFVWILGVFALINGPLMIAFALKAKNGFADEVAVSKN